MIFLSGCVCVLAYLSSDIIIYQVLCLYLSLPIPSPPAEVLHGGQPTADGLSADPQQPRHNHNHLLHLRQPPRVPEVVPLRPQLQEIGRPGLELFQ